MKIKLNFNKVVFLVMALFLSLILIFFFFTFLTIYSKVKSTCLEAQKEYKLSCVDSLTKTVQSDNKTFREKNTAIWTLGQLADKKALPILRNLYTGKDPWKESYDKIINQYELKKAITWCEKGNITSWMYKIFTKHL